MITCSSPPPFVDDHDGVSKRSGSFVGRFTAPLRMLDKEGAAPISTPLRPPAFGGGGGAPLEEERCLSFRLWLERVRARRPMGGSPAPPPARPPASSGWGPTEAREEAKNSASHERGEEAKPARSDADLRLELSSERRCSAPGLWGHVRYVSGKCQ